MLLWIWELDSGKLGVGRLLLHHGRERLEAEAAERLGHEGVADAVHRGIHKLDGCG